MNIMTSAEAAAVVQNCIQGPRRNPSRACKKRRLEYENTTCLKVQEESKKVGFNKDGTLLKYNTLESEPIVMVRLLSSQSSSTVSTEIDDSQDEAANKKGVANETAKKTSQVALSSQTQQVIINPKKPKTYPRQVGRRKERTTEWKDQFRQEKESLYTLFWFVFQRKSTSFFLSSNDDTSIRSVIKEMFKELVNHMQTLCLEDRRFFLTEEIQLNLFLEGFIQRNAVESGLDLLTFKRAAKVEGEVDVLPDVDGSYTLRIIPEEKLHALLSMIPEFLSEGSVAALLLDMSERMVPKSA